MIGGVSFEPGSQDDELRRRTQGQRGAEGVQEAIKVLSLRLPKVIGAQGVAPSALLKAPGGMGRPGVDSIVEQVLAKFFPGGSGGAAQAPMAPQPMGMSPAQPSPGPNAVPYEPPSPSPRPRVVVDSPFGQPPRWPGQPQADGGGTPSDLIGELPPNLPPTWPSQPPSAPDLRPNLDWLPASPQDPYQI